MVAEVVEVLDTVGSGVAEAVAAEGVALVAAAGWSAEPVLQRSEGGFGFDVVRLADEREAAVIVVGARGLTRVNAPVGSVSDAVVNLSRRPVLLVRCVDGGRDVPADGPVVIGDDGSACAQPGIESAGKLLGPRSALVVHVASLRDREDRPAGARELREPPSTPEAVAADGVQRARAAGFNAAGRVERLAARIWRRSVWNARRTIVDIAERERAAVVVVGARGRSVARRLLVGSVASGVLQQKRPAGSHGAGTTSSAEGVTGDVRVDRGGLRRLRPGAGSRQARVHDRAPVWGARPGRPRGRAAEWAAGSRGAAGELRADAGGTGPRVDAPAPGAGGAGTGGNARVADGRARPPGRRAAGCRARCERGSGVAGTHGVGGLKPLLGSVSHQLLEHAPCPVLLVRDDLPAEGRLNVLVALDGSEPSLCGLDVAQVLAGALSATLRLVHVIDARLPLASAPMTGVVEELRRHGRKCSTRPA